MRILIAPDKFKGTLSARDAAAVIARGWRKVRPRDTLDLLPISDGGDGFGSCLGALLNGVPRRTTVVDAAHRHCVAQWHWVSERKMAIVESARAVGLAMLPAGQWHPFQLDTFGLGLWLRRVAAAGARRCILGIGGSATNDGGFGMARALGWEFLDTRGRVIERWTDLARLSTLRGPQRCRFFTDLKVAVDVANPLLGPRGATRVYGPQKGLAARDFIRAEGALARLAEVVCQHVGQDAAAQPGAGAAGGLGFGLAAFAGAELTPGFEMLARLAQLDVRVARADLVITGEGALDRSTLMGKGTGQLALLCQRKGIPCIGIGGVVTLGEGRKRFTQLAALTDLTTERGARAHPAMWLERCAAWLAMKQALAF